MGEAEVAGVVAEVVNSVGQAGQRHPALQELPGSDAEDAIGGASGPSLPGQEVERADEPLRLRGREAGVGGQLERVDGRGGEAEEDEEACGCHWRCITESLERGAVCA